MHSFKKSKNKLPILTCVNANISHRKKLLVIRKVKQHPQTFISVKYLRVIQIFKKAQIPGTVSNILYHLYEEI